MLTFDAEHHKYFYNDLQVPGVSEVLREMGQAKDWSDVPGYYRDRGTAVHLAIKYFLEGSLDRDSLDPVIKPYLDQFEAFLGKLGDISGLILSEQPYYSTQWEFAGTIDLIINGVIWDIKCSKKLDKASQWQYDLQGAAYRTLARDNKIGDFPFKILLLPGEGDAKEISLNAPYRAWENLMALYNIKNDRIPLEVRP